MSVGECSEGLLTPDGLSEYYKPWMRQASGSDSRVGQTVCYFISSRLTAKPVDLRQDDDVGHGQARVLTGTVACLSRACSHDRSRLITTYRAML
jgi:hypothetical protein